MVEATLWKDIAVGDQLRFLTNAEAHTLWQHFFEREAPENVHEWILGPCYPLREEILTVVGREESIELPYRAGIRVYRIEVDLNLVGQNKLVYTRAGEPDDTIINFGWEYILHKAG